MRASTQYICDDPVRIYTPESQDDIDKFVVWLGFNAAEPIAIDVEATGLNQRAPDWCLRTVQFGHRNEAWVIPAELEFAGAIQFGLDTCQIQIAHNRPYDATALEVSGFTHKLWSGFDTMIMSHLVDSRSSRDGGVGHGLKALSEHYVDSEAADSDAALKQWAKDNKIRLGDRFALAPVEVLEVYAGMDVILTRRLYDVLKTVLEELDDALLLDELNIQRACHLMSSRGFRLDIPYARELGEWYAKTGARLKLEMADGYGIENPNSGAQLIAALEREDVELTERTPSGLPAVGKDVLSTIDHPLTNLITEFRHVSKYRVSYVEKCLELVHEGRVHPNIRSLQARTARMAISDPPLQQLPAGDALVRRMFIADEGMVIAAADFSQVELRVLAALADETAMLEAIANGVDLHTNTAERVGLDRKVAKMTNFLIVYGGGKKALATQAGISEMEAGQALAGFKGAFPRITTYGNRLQERSGYGKRPLVTPSGRRLKLDRDRTYAAINYVVQSSARDVMANAMLMVEASKYGGSLLVPVHDELVMQLPSDGADEAVKEVATIMETNFLGVHLQCEGEVFGHSWGHGYLDSGSVPDELKDWF